MKSVRIFSIITFLAILYSCSKDLITPLDSEKIAVVESYLYAGDSIIRVKVSKVLPFSEDTINATEYISGLKLQINGQILTETEPGSYSLNLGDGGIKPETEYSLKFRFFNDTVSSATRIPVLPSNFIISSPTLYTERITSTGGFPGGQMQEVELSWDNTDDSYYYLKLEYLDSDPDYINSAMADYDIPLTQSISPVQSAGTRLGIRNLQFFGHYRIVLFKVNQDFVDLYQHITANSNNITNPVTSIKNGYGVFTGMSSDTVYLEVKEK